MPVRSSRTLAKLETQPDHQEPSKATSTNTKAQYGDQTAPGWRVTVGTYRSLSPGETRLWASIARDEARYCSAPTDSS